MEIAKLDDLPLRRCYDAHRHTSFTPDVRAVQEQKSYAEHINAFAATIMAECTNEAMRSAAPAELERYRAGYVARKLRYMDARARCASTMITGPANFNTARNDKRNATAHKRLEELLEYNDRAQAAIRRNLRALSAEAQEAAAAKALLPVIEDVEFMRGEGFVVMANGELNRLQILFDDKPGEELRAKLKKEAWKWAPSQGAWQRQLTTNAKYSAKRILEAA